MGRRVRVLKVGGSLLDEAALARWLDEWLSQDQRAPAASGATDDRPHDILVAGGGKLVDEIRRLDRRLALDAVTSHWMSIRAMSCTAILLARRLQLPAPVATWQELQSLREAETPQVRVFDVYQWLADREGRQPGIRIRRDWSSTSDSIAGRLAYVLAASEVVLFKSTDGPASSDWSLAAEQGLVDRHFPPLALDLPLITWVNLRNPASWDRL